MAIRLKRVYEHFSPEDGYRVLVDRMWPRGLSKDEAHVDLWLREIAPSNELRKWFGHEPEKWAVFQERYRGELAGSERLLDVLRRAEQDHATVTLLYGAKDTERNQARVIAEVLGAGPDGGRTTQRDREADAAR